MARHRANGSFRVFGIAAAAGVTLVIALLASMLTSGGGSSAQVGDPHPSPTTELRAAGPSESAVVARLPLPAAAAVGALSAAAVSVPALPPTPGRVTTATKAGSSPSARVPTPARSTSGAGQLVTIGASCPRAGVIGHTSAGKLAICWTNASKKLVWISA